MINSLFFVNTQWDVFMEKHWKKVIHKSICDYFFNEQKQASTPQDISPVIQTPHHYLFNIYYNKIYLVAVTTCEVSPLFVIEFLHKIVETIKDYFEECSEKQITENCVTIYEILDEMLDNGFPLATELNVLKELIKPPTKLQKFASTVMGKSNLSATLPEGQLSQIPWRKSGLKYTNSECFFDLIEELNCILDRQGNVVSADIHGYIDAFTKLSGMPDILLTFGNSRIIEDISLHPCVRFHRWEKDRQISFVPPDGSFRLLSYNVTQQNAIAQPFTLNSIINLQNGGKLDITVIPKRSVGKPIENMRLEVCLPKSVQNVTVLPNQGKVSFDPITRNLQWSIGKLDIDKSAFLRGTVVLQSGTVTVDSRPTINVIFHITQVTASGLKVSKLDIFNEKYKPFKGVKYITKSGHFQMRT